MLEPIAMTIEVPCSQEKAFEIFLDDMKTWWPLDKFSVSAMDGKIAKGLRVDAVQGGDIVEIGHDDTTDMHLGGLEVQL